MVSNRSMPPGVIIPEIAYRDVGEAVAGLCAAFGFTERLRIGDHRAQLCLGNESIVVVKQPAGHEAAGSASGFSVMVQVENVDAHYERARRCGAQIIQPPTDYVYGERLYTAEDLGGYRWTFSQSLADVDPAEWGGTLIEHSDDTTLSP